MRFASLALLVCLSCGGGTVRPTPCMSDRECHSDRICHQGRCMFVEEARNAVNGQLAPSEPGSAEVPRPVQTNEQPMFMAGPTHHGRSERRGPTRAPEVAWVHRTTARIFASPIVGPDGAIYIGSQDRTFNAIAPDGSLRWRYAGGERFYSTAALASDGTIYVGCHDGSLVALTARGQMRWRRELPMPV